MQAVGKQKVVNPLPKKKKEKLETYSPGKRILLQQIPPGDKKNIIEIYILGEDMLVF